MWIISEIEGNVIIEMVCTMVRLANNYIENVISERLTLEALWSIAYLLQR